MQGYLIPDRSHLSFEDSRNYFYSQCGLCQTLKENYGSISRFLVNWDSLLLQLLTESQQREAPLKTHINCAVKPKKHLAFSSEVPSKYAAAITLIMLWAKKKDSINDDTGARKVLSKITLSAFKARIENAESILKDLNFDVDQIYQLVEKQDRLETSNTKYSLEDISAPTGQGLGVIFKHSCVIAGNNDNQELFNELGVNLGQTFYILDAIEDFESDIKNHCYNPLHHFDNMEKSEKVIEAYEEFLLSKYQRITHILNRLNLLHHKKIIKNILIFGLGQSISKLTRLGDIIKSEFLDRQIVQTIDCCGIPFCCLPEKNYERREENCCDGIGMLGLQCCFPR